MEKKDVVRNIIISANDFKFKEINGVEFETAVKYYVDQLESNQPEPAMPKIADVDKQEALLRMLYEFYEEQNMNKDKATIYYDMFEKNAEKKKIYTNGVEKTLTAIMHLFGYKITPINE